MRAHTILAAIFLATAAVFSIPAKAGFQDGVRLYRAGEVAKAKSHFEPLARRGHACAQYYLGEIDFRLRKMKSAVRWYSKSAASGVRAAQVQIGLIYLYGLGGLKANPATAANYLKSAANQGDPSAQDYLGGMYRDGNGVRKDLGKAIYWWRKAANQGWMGAALNLGKAYADIQSPLRNDIHAIRWLLIVIRSGRFVKEAERHLATVKGRATKSQMTRAHSMAEQWRSRPTISAKEFTHCKP